MHHVSMVFFVSERRDRNFFRVFFPTQIFEESVIFWVGWSKGNAQILIRIMVNRNV